MPNEKRCIVCDALYRGASNALQPPLGLCPQCASDPVKREEGLARLRKERPSSHAHTFNMWGGVK